MHRVGVKLVNFQTPLRPVNRFAHKHAYAYMRTKHHNAKADTAEPGFSGEGKCCVCR